MNIRNEKNYELFRNKIDYSSPMRSFGIIGFKIPCSFQKLSGYKIFLGSDFKISTATNISNYSEEQWFSVCMFAYTQK